MFVGRKSSKQQKSLIEGDLTSREMKDAGVMLQAKLKVQSRKKKGEKPKKKKRKKKKKKKKKKGKKINANAERDGAM